MAPNSTSPSQGSNIDCLTYTSVLSVTLKGNGILHGLRQSPAACRSPVILPPLREFTDRWTTVAGKSRDFPLRHKCSLLYKGEEHRTEMPSSSVVTWYHEPISLFCVNFTETMTTPVFHGLAQTFTAFLSNTISCVPFNTFKHI